MTTITSGPSKPADLDHPVHEMIAERWSPRAFSSRAVTSAAVLSVLEAARWAPSADNGQPWHFLVAVSEQPEGFARLLGLLSRGNQRWASHAPVLMLAAARLYVEYSGHPAYRSLYDLGLAVGMLAVQATSGSRRN